MKPPTPPVPSPSSPPQALLQRLRAARDAASARPFSERREAVLGALRAEIAAFGDDPTPTLDALRDALTDEARTREVRQGELDRALAAAREEIRRLAGERDTLAAEKARLVSDITQAAAAAAAARAESSTSSELQTRVEELERELAHVAQVREKEMIARRSLEQEIAGLRAKIESGEQKARDLERAAREASVKTQITTAIPPPPPAPIPMEGDALGRLRVSLATTANTGDIPSDRADLPASEYRLVRLTQELLKFALDYDRGIQAFLMGLSITNELDTRQIARQEELVKKRFLDCLEDQDGSLGRLRDALERNRRFVLDLNEAYTRAIPEGVRTILRELDPNSMLESKKGRFGIKDPGEALRALGERNAMLMETPAQELRARYFEPSIRTALTGKR